MVVWMGRQLTIDMEIMLYVDCAQSQDMLLELLSRPQIETPTSFWDSLMNVTRLNSTNYISRVFDVDNKFTNKQLQDASIRAGVHVMDEKKYSVRDYIRAVDQLEALREKIEEHPGTIKVSVDQFYRNVSVRIFEGRQKINEGQVIDSLPEYETPDEE